MSDAAAVLAAPVTIKHKGREYPVSPLTLDMIAMFERWLENRAFETIEVRKGQISEDNYERLLASWIEQCASGRYRWGSPAMGKAARSRDGLAFMFFLQLAEKTPDMNPKLAAEIMQFQVEEVQAKMGVVNAPPFAAAVPTPETTA